jgi:hypothetical protein
MCVQKNAFHFCKDCKVPLYGHDTKEIKRCSIAVTSCDECCGFVEHVNAHVYDNFCSNCNLQPDMDPYAGPRHPDSKKKRVSWSDEQQGGKLAIITEIPRTPELGAEEMDPLHTYYKEKFTLV